MVPQGAERLQARGHRGVGEELTRWYDRRVMRSRHPALAVFACTFIACAGTRSAAHTGPQQPPSEAREVNQETLARFVRSHMGSVKACYENALKRDPTLRGRIAIRFAIREDGSIGDVVSASDTMETSDVGTCMIRVFRSWRTPFRPDGPVTVEYPFIFQPVQ